MRLTSGWMWGSIVVLSFVVEDWRGLFYGTEYFYSIGGVVKTVGIAGGGGLLAICMILSEFSLILNSSAVVLTIGGVIKELCTILLGVIVFSDNVTELNLVGFGVVLLGVGMFKFRPKEENVNPYGRVEDEEDDRLENFEESIELVGVGGEANDGFEDYEEEDEEEDEEALHHEIWGDKNPFNT